jgi:hypothetical protein
MLSKSFAPLKKHFMNPLGVRAFSSTSDKPKRVVVTGAAGQIAYSILFRIAR